MAAYYNEVDPYAVQWIRNLIAAGLVTGGEVDDRSIVDVQPLDLRGFTRCHFFAGIAVWDYALGLAGWPADRPVWTGSCPCQPFSAAGKGGGFDDERHLWPAWYHLIRERRPAEILGEQVASKDGLGWLDLVQSDMEGEGYAGGAIDLCAAGVGAPHIRQRQWLWFVANAGGGERSAGRRGHHRRAASLVEVRFDADGRGTGFMAVPTEPGSQGCLAAGQRPDAQLAASERGGAACLMDHASSSRGWRHAGAVPGAQGEGAEERGRVGHQPHELVSAGAACLLGDAGSEGRGQVGSDGRGRRPGSEAQGLAERPLHERARSYWSDADWIACRDGKARPVEPGTFPLAHGAPARVGRLRAYGNAINAEASAAFIGACLEVRP